MHTREKGAFGEDAAAKFLKSRGFEIVAKNYCIRGNLHGGEVDIIARKGTMLHFVEVKSRISDTFGMGREAVTPAKQRNIRRAATHYLVTHGLVDKIQCCFDVVEITPTGAELFENCF